MSYDLELLETFARYLQKQPFLNDLDTSLEDETRRLKKVILFQLMTMTNETQLNTYLQINLYKLVEICDNLYMPDSFENANSLAVLDLFIAIRKASGQIILPDLEIPLLLRKTLTSKFVAHWSVTKKKLQDNGIDEPLVETIGFAYSNFAISINRPQWTQVKYLNLFCETLSALPEQITVDTIIYLLIKMGYNYSRFTVYCYRWMEQKFSFNGFVDKHQLIYSFKREFRQLELFTSDSFDHRKIDMITELCKWLDEEQANLKAMSEPSVNPMKLNTTLKVLELAYWKKLQYDSGIYDEINLDVFSEKVAYNYSTKNQEELSAPSIKSKFYPKDRSIIEPIEGLLVKMLKEVRLFLG